MCYYCWRVTGDNQIQTMKKWPYAEVAVNVDIGRHSINSGTNGGLWSWIDRKPSIGQLHVCTLGTLSATKEVPPEKSVNQRNLVIWTKQMVCSWGHNLSKVAVLTNYGLNSNSSYRVSVLTVTHSHHPGLISLTLTLRMNTNLLQSKLFQTDFNPDWSGSTDHQAWT